MAGGTMSTELPRGWAMPWPGPEVAREAEQRGALAFCAGEFADHNAYLSVGEMVSETSTALIGTGVAYAFARSPFIHAAAVRHLHQRAPGRIFLGLGSGTRRMNEQWFASQFERPLARMEEMVRAIRAFLVAEKMETVRVADGVIGHGIFTDRWWLETIDPRLDESAASVGRDPASLRRWGWVITS